MASLLFYRGEEKLIEYRLQSTRTSIGRADTCDVALPGESISRTHCFVVQREGGFEVIDRSRHGISVGGQPVKRIALTDGDEIGLGGYRVVFRAERNGVPPAAESVPDRAFEVVVDAGVDAVVVERVSLAVCSGPDEGSRKVLKKSRVSVGRRTCDLRFKDASIIEEHCFVRVARGRVMIEPGRGAAFIDGH